MRDVPFVGRVSVSPLTHNAVANHSCGSPCTYRAAICPPDMKVPHIRTVAAHNHVCIFYPQGDRPAARETDCSISLETRIENDRHTIFGLS